MFPRPTGAIKDLGQFLYQSAPMVCGITANIKYTNPARGILTKALEGRFRS